MAMTEAQWLASNAPEQMLDFLGSRASARRLRHFLIACARSVLPARADRDMREALAVAERYADGIGSERDLARARASLKTRHAERVRRWPKLYTDHIRSVPAWHATRAQIVRWAGQGSACCAWSTSRTLFAGSQAMAYPAKELAKQADFMRDIFGNPFVARTMDAVWRSTAVVAIAEGVCTDRVFDRLPILADALEDAGCTDADILAHCRGGGEHVRGCWVVDLLTGRK
jgi:hypothetical protein